jgi:hypothetical protein
MKKIILLFFGIFLFEVLIQIIDLFYSNSILSIFKTLTCLPLSLINRSYPFYAERSPFFGIILIVINVIIQTLIVLFVKEKVISKKYKT